MSSEDTTLDELEEELKELKAEFKKILKKVSDFEDMVALENIQGAINKE